MNREETTSAWKKWVDENIKSKEGKLEFYNGINWMNNNWNCVNNLPNSDYYHPGIVFSNVMDNIIKNYSTACGYKEILLKFLLDDFKCPFGMIIKNKALKAIRRNLNLLNQVDINNLVNLSNKLNSMSFKPRELAELHKTIKSAQQTDASETMT